MFVVFIPYTLFSLFLPFINNTSSFIAGRKEDDEEDVCPLWFIFTSNKKVEKKISKNNKSRIDVDCVSFFFLRLQPDNIKLIVRYLALQIFLLSRNKSSDVVDNPFL